MSCCTNILDLGCINFCDLVETGLLAPATDTYTIEDTTTNSFFTVDIVAGAEIQFTNRFNEDMVTVFKIKRGGSYISSGIYDCFQVTVNAGVTLDATTTACEDATVTNSDDTYTETVVCGDTLILPDTTYNVEISGNLTQSFTLPTLADSIVNIYP